MRIASRFFGITSFVLYALPLLVLASACTKQRPVENFNFYGGASRASNYEAGGSFTTMIITDFPKQKTGVTSAADMPKGAVVPPVPISFNQNYLVSADGYAVRYANNTLAWKSPLDALPSGKRATAAAFTAADNSDNFYVFANDGAIYSFDKQGKRRWKQVLFTPAEQSLFSDLCILQNAIIAAFSNDGTKGTIIKCNLEGKILWQRTFTLAPTRTIAADAEGNIVCALTHNIAGKTDSLLSLNADGTPRWGVALENTRILRSPVLAQGMVLLSGICERNGTRIDILHTVDAASGKKRWTKELTFTPQGISVGTQESANARLIVVAGYRVGVGEPLSLLYGLDANGQELWRLSYDLALVGAPMVGAENIAFVGTKGDALGVYIMRKDGVFQQVISLSDAPLLCLVPGVDVQNNLVFAATEQLGLIKVGNLPAQRLLPY